MKAICKNDGSFVGLIPDLETYEKLKAGTTDWKEESKHKIKAIQMPYSLFLHLMKLEVAVEAACARKKAEEEQSND